jgi:NADPH:quinone reductase-like Zn-dependent oxidoreductase
MKAVIVKEPGGIENLLIQEIEKPSPKPDEVLVKVQAISINPVDIKTRKGGALYATLKEHPPVVLGWDISGIVEDAGSQVKKFKKGDAVFGMVHFPGRGGAYAAYVVAPEAHLALKPDLISHSEAAATTLAALTAWQVLVHQAQIKKGDHVLIHAAAGGVGHFAVQLATYFGAEVSGTASAANRDFLRELGVRHFIDYTAPDPYKQVQPMDIILDPIGGATTLQSFLLLNHGGKLISIVGGVKEPLPAFIQDRNIQAKNYLVHSSGRDMEQLALLMDKGLLKPYISHQFPFDEIAQAHKQIETGKTRGKIVANL